MSSVINRCRAAPHGLADSRLTGTVPDVIVVIGQPLYREAEAGASVDGLPARVALAAAAHGRPVQLVGKVGEDAAGDAVVLALAQGSVGHVALLREAGRPTPRFIAAGHDTTDAETGAPTGVDDDALEAPAGPDQAEAAAVLDAADVDLALRYLTDFSVVVLADPVDAEVVRVVSSAASWGDSRLIVVVLVGQVAPDGLPPESIVFEGPDADPDGVFAAMVGSFAAALDDGGDPQEAFSIATDGWTPTATNDPDDE